MKNLASLVGTESESFYLSHAVTQILLSTFQGNVIGRPEATVETHVNFFQRSEIVL
jgi:hypothetical protein